MSCEPLVIRAARRSLDALIGGDIDVYADTLAEDYRFEDRRLGLKSSHDKQTNIDQARVAADLGLEAAELEIIEVRGDRHALFRLTFTASDFTLPMFCVQEVDADGRLLVGVMMDEDALDDARAELNAALATREQL